MITSKEVFQDIKHYAIEIWNKKYIILGVTVLAAAYYIYSSMSQPKKYVAEKTFMVSDDEGGGGISSILGQFGFGAAGGSKNNYQKITEIGRSNLIIDRVLMDSAELDGNKDLIANHVIKQLNLHKSWEDSDSINGFLFTDSNVNTNNASAVKKILQALVRGNTELPSPGGIVDITYDLESTILRISASTPSASLSIKLAETSFDKLAEFYIDKAIQSQRATYIQLKNKADSVAALLSGNEKSYAQNSDFNQGLVLNSDRLSQARSMRNIEVYATMYGEVLKNKETAEFMLNSQTPYFQAIDSPYLPLYNQNKFSLIGTILFVLGVAIVAMLLVVVYGYYLKEVKPHFS
jgi:uncharacterized protein involved in exopolysaccharide biosynthesis